MILVDTGEGSASLLSHPQLASLALPCQLPSPPFSSTRADIMFHGNGPGNLDYRIGIEVKRLTEFATSLSTGRLQATQLPGLLHLYDVRWLLIITGTSRRNPETGALQTRRKIQGEWFWVDWTHGTRTVQYSYLQRFLVSPSFTQYRDTLGEGIRFDKVFDYREAAAWIIDLYETWQKPYAKHSSMKVLDRSGNQNGLTEQSVRAKLTQLSDPRLNDPAFAQRVRTASSLPHVSYTRAIALAEHFPSAQRMLNPLCMCDPDPEAEDRVWAAVRTATVTEQETETGKGASSKGRRLGISLGKEIGRAVR